MKCSGCNGTGIDDDRLTCYKCGGSGEVEMSNEEYIRSCSTEELPKALKEMFFDIKSRVRSGKLYRPYHISLL